MYILENEKRSCSGDRLLLDTQIQIRKSLSLETHTYYTEVSELRDPHLTLLRVPKITCDSLRLEDIFSDRLLDTKQLR